MKKLFILLWLVFAAFQPIAAQNSPENAAAEKTAQRAAQPMGEDERIGFMVERETAANTTAPSAGGLIVRTIGAMCLIVGLIFGVAWGLKKFGVVQFGKQTEDSPDLAVLSSVSLGANRTLSIVRFGERTLLIGSTPQSVSVLATETSGEQQITPRSVADLLAGDGDVSFDDELADTQSRLRNFEAERSNA